MTNDPRSTRSELASRLTEIGTPTDAQGVLTSATATAELIGEEHPGARVLSVGTDALERELEAAGLDPVTATGAESAGFDAVVVGGGARFDYEVLRATSTAVRDGAALWATNKDPTYPTSSGLVPGTGAIVAAIEVASDTEARNVGKPEPALFESALERLACERPLMAGDSLHSDVVGAARAGMATALVLTGRDGRDDVQGAPAQPHHVFEDLRSLAAELA